MSNQLNDTDVYILAAGRTPMGGLLGSLASLTAIDLGKHVVQGTLARTPLRTDEIDEVVFGNVIAAGNGQNPARQVAVKAGLPHSTPATTINKVCASGLKAVAFASQAIRLGDAHTVIAGGTESMTNAPHLFPKARTGVKYGSAEIVDAVAVDGLTDAFGQYAMGVAAEATNRDYALTREMQDDYAIESYTKAGAATRDGKFAEIIPVEVAQGKGKPNKLVTADDEVSNFLPDKMRTLRPSFDPKGSVTAANASPLSDGAAAIVLVSGKKLKQLVADGRLAPHSTTVFKVLATADAEQEPVKFTTTPAVALPKALAKAGISADQLDFVELNEAFACVALANVHILGLPKEKVNVFGGAVAMGHPLGASGARILATLTTVLNAHNARYGAAAICNGGGGATACVIERVQLAGALENRL
ncbi:Thiolase, N-terminal domain-domain-containing protein [Catenaria anguillulae PL171]|uniref:acetyl-CoA C-acetyltransferase n=1 Tax=Catenaria anguillulae PL171 TaxID=765915 RepID=A0A1Y2HRG5_9FUNG|nr:Thiolase, N-terminal domain-domain-containing protein [Catenaria anguillulae PL171]